jgi:hypothetical protein
MNEQWRKNWNMPVKLANLERDNPFDRQNVKTDIFPVKKRMESV